MMSWTWLPVDRKATPAEQPADLELPIGEGRRAVRGGGRVATILTRTIRMARTTRVLTPTRSLIHNRTGIAGNSISGASA